MYRVNRSGVTPIEITEITATNIAYADYINDARHYSAIQEGLEFYASINDAVKRFKEYLNRDEIRGIDYDMRLKNNVQICDAASNKIYKSTYAISEHRVKEFELLKVLYDGVYCRSIKTECYHWFSHKEFNYFNIDFDKANKWEFKG